MCLLSEEEEVKYSIKASRANPSIYIYSQQSQSTTTKNHDLIPLTTSWIDETLHELASYVAMGCTCVYIVYMSIYICSLFRFKLFYTAVLFDNISNANSFVLKMGPLWHMPKPSWPSKDTHKTL